VVEHEWSGCGQTLENWERDGILVLCRNHSYMIGYLVIVMMYVDFISSPYLLVFGDDRVHGTREQRMLMQVELVTLSYGEGISGVFNICIFYFWKWNVNSFETFILDYDILVILNFGFHYIHLWKFKFSRILGKWGIIKCSVIYLLLYFIYKSVISWRDVTFGIRALFSKWFLGSKGSELVVLRIVWLIDCVDLILI